MIRDGDGDRLATANSPAPLRLAVWHLLLWMVFTAAVAAISEAIMFRAPGETTDPWWMTIRLIFDVAYGLALTGFVVIVGELARGRRRQLAPGHLMILLGAVAAIADGGAYVFLHYVVRHFWWPAWQPEYTYWLIHQATGYTLIGLVWTCLIPLWGISVRWKFGFAALGLLMLSQGAINLWLLLQVLGAAPYLLDATFPAYWIVGASLACTLILIGEIVADWRAGLRYDWLHWAGVLLSLAPAINQWVRSAKEIFFTPA